MRHKPVSLFSSNLVQRIVSGLFLIGLSLGCLWKGPLWSTGLVILLFIGLFVEWTRLCFFHGNSTFKNKLIFLGGLIYLGGAFLFCWEHAKPSLNPVQIDVSYRFFLYLFCLVWATDISAYMVGKILGGPRLAPKISPKKTWAGFFGGLVGGSLVGILIFPEFNGSLSSKIVTVSLVLVAIGGDLLESAIKRYFNVKDTSALIPGHGGLLDRLDSFLAVAFVLFCLNF